MNELAYNSTLITDPTIQLVNATILVLCGLEALILLMSFRRFMLELEASRIFFIKMLLTMCTMFAYAVSFLHHPHPHDVLFIITTAIAYAGIYAVQYLYVRYLIVNINMNQAKKNPVLPVVNYLTLIFCVISGMLWILSIFEERFAILESPAVYFGPLFWVGHVGEWILVIISFVLLLRYRHILGNRQTIILMSMPILLLIATLVEPFMNGVELRYPAIMLEFLIVYTQHHLDLENAAQKEEVESMQTRLALASGRMKPHYMYNVLTTIYYLCESDPEKAQHAIATFSDYLRNTLETMEKQDLVNFSWELGQIRNYLSLEKLRFEDRLQVVYDTEIDDFMVPPLSIQPLVENAVKHGIAATETGGTVRIITRRLSDGGAQVRVVDDGVGFDITKIKNLDVTHEGLANVRERIRLECGGDMTITSAPGKGTTVMVTLRPHEAGT